MFCRFIVMTFMVALAAPAGEPADPLTVTNATDTNSAVAPSSDVLPMIQFNEAPISAVIMNLARQADINFIIDPELFLTTANGQAATEPVVTFCLWNVTAKETLERMLALRNLALVEGPISQVTRITRNAQPRNVVDASLLDLTTNHLDFDTNDIIPVIQFAEVPLDAGLENLIRISGMNIELDPRVKNHRDSLNRPTIVSLRWTKITAKQAIVALCENYDLTITKDATSGVIQIKPNEAKKHHHLQLH